MGTTLQSHARAIQTLQEEMHSVSASLKKYIWNVWIAPLLRKIGKVSLILYDIKKSMLIPYCSVSNNWGWTELFGSITSVACVSRDYMYILLIGVPVVWKVQVCCWGIICILHIEHLWVLFSLMINSQT